MTRFFGPAFGMLMVVTAGATGGPVVLGVLGVALVAVAVSMVDTRAATAAVLLSIVGLAVSDPSPVFAAVSGMSAAVYLVITHGHRSGAAGITVPTVAGLIGFTIAGLAAIAIALPLDWIPLLAPAIVAAVLIVAAHPLLADDRTGSLRAPGSDGTTAG